MGALLVLQLNRGKYFILMNNCTRILFVEDVLSDAELAVRELKKRVLRQIWG